LTIQDAFKRFLRSRQIKGLSDRTLDSYHNLTAPFLSFIGHDTAMEEITPDDLEDFMDHLFGRSLSQNSVASYARNARIFLKWYQKKNLVQYDYTDLPIPKTPQKIVRIYTPDEIRTIFQTVATCSLWLDARNRAIIALMLDSGIRQGEVCSLLLENVDFDNKRMKVCGKGNKERFVPLGDTSIRFLQEYLRLRPYGLSQVFVSYHGEVLTCDAVKSMTGDLQALLPFEFSSHKLRHNFATNYLVNQYDQFGHMDIYQLMVIMGHEDVATVRKYLHEANNLIASRCCISHLDKYLPDVI